MEQSQQKQKQLPAYDLKAVHQANLRILKEIDRICRKYKIRYALDAGTLIGAVRHSGFIPWDDDADVVFLRSQYEAFVKVAKRELPETMELLFPDSYRDGKAFFDFTPPDYLQKQPLPCGQPGDGFLRRKAEPPVCDIFIQDELPEGKLPAAWTRLKNTMIYGLAMGHRFRLDFPDRFHLSLLYML